MPKADGGWSSVSVAIVGIDADSETFAQCSGRLMRTQSPALLRRWRRRWYSPTTPARRGWLGDRSATHNTLKARRKKSIRVADHRRSVLNRVPVRAVRVRHPVAIGERDLRAHTAAGAVANMHVGHVRVRDRVGVSRCSGQHGRCGGA